MTPPDPITALVEFLSDDEAITARAAGRVFGGELPESENDSMPRAAVVISPAGPPTMGLAFQRYSDLRVDVDCYGATPSEAFDLYRDVKSALKNLSGATYNEMRLYWCRQSAGPSEGRDPDTDWPMSLSSWQVLHSE